MYKKFCNFFPLFFWFEANSHNWDVLYTDNYYINMSDDMLLQEV